MSAGNTLSAASGSGLSGHPFCIASCSGLKRRNDSFSEDICPPEKRWYYVLASESEIETEGSESIYSIQEKSTDLAKDTSDTSTKSSWSLSSYDEGRRMIEFEVVSTEEMQYHLKSTSSSHEDVDLLTWLPEIERSREALLANYSEAESAREIKLIHLDKKSGVPGLFKFCLQCKETNKYPQFRYCVRCHKSMKNSLPPRPQGGKRKKLSKIRLDNKESTESGICLTSSQSLQNANSEELRNVDTELCNICMIRSKDGGFSHGHIIHNYSCYRCSVKIYNQNGRCPVCNIKVKQICKIIM